MIATGLTFLFGVLVTTLLAILIAPLVWRKAQSLAKRDYEATIPTSANEIRAGFDRVRAEAAMSVRRQEILAARAQEKSARTQAELGRGTVENVELLKRIRGLNTTLEERHTEVAGLSAKLADTTSRHEQLSAELQGVRAEADASAEALALLAERFENVGEIAEERKIQLIAAEAKLDRFADDGRTNQRGEREAKAAIDRLGDEAAAAIRANTEEKATSARLSTRLDAMVADLADRDEEITGLKQQLAAALASAAEASASRSAAPSPAEAVESASPARTVSAGQRLRAAIERQNSHQEDAADDTAETGQPAIGSAEVGPAEIGDAISDLAARIIRMVAVSEGPTSPLASLAATRIPSGKSGPMTLAERVALLAEADSGPASAILQPVPSRPE